MRRHEFVAVWRSRIVAEVRVVQLDHQMFQRMRRIGEHHVYVMVPLAFDAGNRADNAIDAELFGADSAIPSRSALRGDRIQRRDRRIDGSIELNEGRRRIAEALYMCSTDCASHGDYGTTPSGHSGRSGGRGRASPPACRAATPYSHRARGTLS